MSQASIARKKIDLYNSPEGTEIRQALEAMELDGTIRTESSYTANVAKYPDKSISFVENHLAYLTKHAELDPEHYLANLRLMLKIRN